MSFFDEVKKTFLDREELFNLRFNASKYIFIIMCLVFFLDYFFIANNFFAYILNGSLGIVYILFLFSFFIFSCFLIARALYGTSKVNQAFIFMIIFGVVLLLSIPFVFPKDFLNII
ncbi:hypothetical protein EOM39_01630 [Candidatus Gracilibacteria bacterium]|nr:hypothetical protein [Candidatus Gracilibacteria bacterium]